MSNASEITARLLDWFRAHARPLPWRQTTDPYAIWVSEIMLQQTQVATVIPYWTRWIAELPTVEHLARARESKVLKLWEGLGYYHRARNMRKAAGEIVRDHGGKFPRTAEGIAALPGIGPYTLGAIQSIAFNDPAPAVDGNVVRVIARLAGIAESTGAASTIENIRTLAGNLLQNATQIPGERNCANLTQALMELGALVCTPRTPRCANCPVSRNCYAFTHGCVDRLPNLPERVATTDRRFAAFVVRDGDKYLVQQRPKGVVNALLWEFPNIEAPAPTISRGLKRLATIRHSITRYRIRMDVYAATDTKPFLNEQTVWRTITQMRRLAFPSAHRRIVELLNK